MAQDYYYMRALLFVLSLSPCFYSLSQAPNAQFSGSPLSVCLGDPITFVNQSTPNGSPIASSVWDFGNGEGANTSNAVYTYPAAGTYTVILTVTSASGQSDAEVKTNYVTVHPKPVASFTTSGNGCTVPFGVSFNNTSTSGAGITYAWNFGNGQTSNQQIPPVVNYASAGTFTVTLTVTNTATGCSATTSQSLVVSNYSAGITAPATACVGTPVTIQDNSTVGANAWSWSFTGGQTSTAENPTITFTTPGPVTISLTSQNTTSGCSGSATQQINILPKPVPSFTASPTTGCAPTPVVFTNTSPPGTDFEWDFGNGATFSGQNPPTQVYNANGTYNVTLTMTDANGCTGSAAMNSLINISDPVVLFSSVVVNGCDPLEVQFTDASTSPNPTSNPITGWDWDFGDGTNFSGQTPPVHTYSVGVYDVTLTITTLTGCTATLTLEEYIQVGLVNQVNFSVDPTIECAKTDVEFTNLTVINAPHEPGEVTYSWDFGDGQQSAEENPVHQYDSDTGYFDVTLIVNFRGCRDTLIIPQAVYIKAPISLFTVQQLYCNPVSFPVNVAVNDQSTMGALPDDVSMIWRWGDGSDTNFDDPDLDDTDRGSTSHDYMDYGTYTIKQVIYNTTTGCSDSTTHGIYISQTVAGFTVANDSVCKSSALQLTSTSTSTHTFGTWSFDMGNGSVVNAGPTPTYAYPQAGTYTIVLTATNSVGCSHTASFTPLQVLELPSAQISADDNAGCAPFLVTFSNGSSVQGNGVPLESFAWTFSDDNSLQTTTNVASTVTHTFNTEGNFNATLVATDEFGCKSAPASVQIAITKPLGAFDIEEVICNQENYSSVNGTTGFGPLSYQWFIDGVLSSTNTEVTGTFNEPQNTSINHTTHVFTMIATDINGCKDTVTTPVVVSIPVAVIDFDLDGASVNANGEYTCPPVFGSYTDVTNSYGDVVSWSWNFGDGKSSVLESPSNTYVFPGTYSLTLSIEDEYGCTSDTTLTDYLTIFGPVGTPGWSQIAGQCGQNVNFALTDTSNVVSWSWNMDDGTIVNDSMTFTHVYQSVDSFDPTITLVDALGCEVIYPMPTITIPDSGLDALFTADPTETDLGGTIVFDDQSTSSAPIVSWTWDFGNGSSVTNLTDESVPYFYYIPGNKVITLTVVDANGCKDQYQLIVFVDGNFNMPNVFTPNGDDANDVLTLKADYFLNFDIMVQNRWGNVVQNKTNQTGTLLWDGTDNGGKLCNDGVYFFLLSGTLKDGSPLQKSGFVTVVNAQE